jgi:hypothetical protein
MENSRERARKKPENARARARAANFIHSENSQKKNDEKREEKKCFNLPFFFFLCFVPLELHKYTHTYRRGAVEVSHKHTQRAAST